MNTVIDSLLSRRSVRSFTDQQITDQELNTILEAGQFAPSGRGEQPWIFIAAQDPALRAKLTKMNAAVMGADSDPYYGAPTIIFVLVDRTKHTLIESGSLALGNMMNAAHALGLGSCWIHRAYEMFETDEGKALLREWGFEGDYQGIGACIVGYPAEPLPEAKARVSNTIRIIK